jgi:hypothetical protein
MLPRILSLSRPAKELCHPQLSAHGSYKTKYYQLAYVNFIGGLIAKLPLASCAFPRPDDDNLPSTTLDLLMSALTNIRQEVEFYEMTGQI